MLHPLATHPHCTCRGRPQGGALHSARCCHTPSPTFLAYCAPQFTLPPYPSPLTPCHQVYTLGSAMLVPIPSLSGEPLGVLQLVNRKLTPTLTLTLTLTLKVTLTLTLAHP